MWPGRERRKVRFPAVCRFVNIWGAGSSSQGILRGSRPMNRVLLGLSCPLGDE
jgi:hypothetical protein